MYRIAVIFRQENEKLQRINKLIKSVQLRKINAKIPIQILHVKSIYYV